MVIKNFHVFLVLAGNEKKDFRIIPGEFVYNVAKKYANEKGFEMIGLERDFGASPKYKYEMVFAVRNNETHIHQVWVREPW